MVAGDLASMHWAATYGMLYRRTQLVDSTLSLRGLQMPFDASGALILHLLSIRKVSKALGLSKHCRLQRQKDLPRARCRRRFRKTRWWEGFRVSGPSAFRRHAGAPGRSRPH